MSVKKKKKSDIAMMTHGEIMAHVPDGFVQKRTDKFSACFPAPTLDPSFHSFSTVRPDMSRKGPEPILSENWLVLVTFSW